MYLHWWFIAIQPLPIISIFIGTCFLWTCPWKWSLASTDNVYVPVTIMLSGTLYLLFIGIIILCAIIINFLELYGTTTHQTHAYSLLWTHACKLEATGCFACNNCIRTKTSIGTKLSFKCTWKGTFIIP